MHFSDFDADDFASIEARINPKDPTAHVATAEMAVEGLEAISDGIDRQPAAAP